MNTSRRTFLGAAAGMFAARRSAPPQPWGAVPSVRQLAWSELEFYTFLHFTVDTFTDKEWGYGDEDPAVFNPTAFDADQIVEALKAAGSTGAILTCKHHDGFCLWPTATTDHSIRRSPYRGGQGDIVREISDAAHRQGLKFGVYVSPWDRHQASYGTPEYVELYRRQIRELLTGYGPIFEVWHDGANGGDGYYGGARETRNIDRSQYYGWETTWKMERELQPGAMLFSDVGPDVRWVGNEKGVAGETCWATYTPHSRSGGAAVPGDIREQESVTGTRNGAVWMPAECDVSIRPGWFWHAVEDDKVKTPRQLLDLYYASVGRGASFLLNVPPDRRGRIHENDEGSLRAFGRLLRGTLAKNLVAGAKARASAVRGNDPAYAAGNLIDGNAATYWSTDDSVTRADVTFDLPRPATFQFARLREHIALGQRVGAFAIEVWSGSEWTSFGRGTSIGMGRILRAERPVTASRVRLRIEEAAACPALSEFALFAEADEA